MASEWLGTFNLSQFNRLAAFARAQVADIDDRIAHLNAELDRIGNLVAIYDKGTVTAYEGDPSDSYIGKLVSVYEVLGGDTFFDLQVRQRDTQPLYLLRSNETAPARQLSDGRIVGVEGMGDAQSANFVQQLRDWMHESIQYKREAIERKVRRALDYRDQLTSEITTLQTIKGGKDVEGSLENLIDQINQLIADRRYRSIADDKGQDPNGLLANAPFFGLEPGGSRQAEDFGRGLDGYATPEDTKA